jgi:regulator of replication initiation timing
MNEELDVNEILSAMRQQVGTMAQENAILSARIKKLEALLKEKDDRE